MTTAAIYARQSVYVPEGIDRQRERAAALIASRGWALGPTYTDNDTSASKARGPHTGWGRMLNDTGRAFDVVVAVDLDRLLRTTKDLNTLIDAGARVVTVDGEIDLSTADGEFRATMLAGIARFEVRRKAERQRRANEARVAQGRSSTVPRQRPFGFEPDGITHRPDEVEAIREAYRALIGGSSLGAIARRWNEAGHRTSRGNEWSPGAVSLVLASPRYWGRVTYHRQDAGSAEWQPVVDESTWRTARALLAVGRTGQAPYGRTLLGGIARCGVCNNDMTVRGGSNNGRRSYRCEGPVQHLSRKAEPVEELIESVVIARLSRPDAAFLFAPHKEDLGPLTTEAEQVRARLDALAVEFADGALTASQIRTATKRLRDRLGELEAQLARARREVEFAPLLDSQPAKEAWNGLDIDQRRRLVDTLMSVTLLPAPRGRKVFDPASVQIDWKRPGS